MGVDEAVQKAWDVGIKGSQDRTRGDPTGQIKEKEWKDDKGRARDSGRDQQGGGKEGLGAQENQEKGVGGVTNGVKGRWSHINEAISDFGQSNFRVMVGAGAPGR